MSSAIYKGVVVWFSAQKGFGFIRPAEADQEDRSQDVFVHYTGIDNRGKGRRNLLEKQRVQYEIGRGKDDKLMAIHVEVVAE